MEAEASKESKKVSQCEVIGSDLLSLEDESMDLLEEQKKKKEAAAEEEE